MRHFLANLAVYVLATVLVVVAVLFAWIRSEQVIIATERAVESPHFAVVDEPEQFAWEAFGERVYRANCQACHGGRGQGRDVYPPLQGQSALLAATGGREYMVWASLYGAWTGAHPAPMPPFANLSDAQIAAVNNFILTRFDDPERLPAGARLFVPSDVAIERGRDWRERDVGEVRPDVPLPRELARLAAPRDNPPAGG